MAEPDFPGGRAFLVSIFLSVFNVHVNRVPRSGRVTGLSYFPGAFLDARNPESAVRNEQLWIDFEEAGSGRPLRVKQISGAIARRIVCWLRPGDEVKAGDKVTKWVPKRPLRPGEKGTLRVRAIDGDWKGPDTMVHFTVKGQR